MNAEVLKPDYGIDAPGVRRGMLAGGIGGLVLVGVGVIGIALGSGMLSRVAAILTAVAGLAALYGLGMAAYMTYGSRVGKLRTRERLFDLAHAIGPLTGHERVLDIGCGRGLMMVGAARRLPSGEAVGIDLWQEKDQAGNSPAAAQENARREGVGDRVSVKTGDARALPFDDDASFDMVVSHWVIHNLPNATDRARALDEMLRVLRPGGTLVLADIAHHRDYLEQLAACGLTSIKNYSGGWESMIIGFLSGGSFMPQAVIGRRVLR